MIRAQHQLILLLIMLLIVPVLAACGDEEPPVLPTRWAPPSPTNTPLPTITMTPSRTPYPSFTPSYTYTPTLTRTPSSTPTPTRTSTPTLVPATATFTATWTPPFTATPSPTATPNLPQILSFTSTVSTAPMGSSLTLSWTSNNADMAQLEQLDRNQVVLQTATVSPTGQLPVTVPNTVGNVYYRLTVFRADRLDTRTIAVQVTCAISWFFGDQYAPPNTGCPLGPATAFVGKYQPFERGIMFNVVVNGEDRVYGLNGVQQRYMVYTNAWDGVTVHTGICGVAPQGLFNPEDVFNWLYHTQLGTVGQWCDPSGIGWAVSHANLAVTLTLQFESNTPAFFVNIPGYGTFRISNEGGFSGTWSPLSAP